MVGGGCSKTERKFAGGRSIVKCRDRAARFQGSLGLFARSPWHLTCSEAPPTERFTISYEAFLAPRGRVMGLFELPRTVVA